MAGRRGNGEGSIYYSDKLNRWVGQFTAGVKTNGMPNRKSVYGKTRKEVADKITKALNEIKEHTFVDKSDITLRELMEEIINYKHSTGLVTDSTFYRNKETIKQIEKNPVQILDLPIQKISDKNLKQFFSYTQDFSNSTIDKIHILINSTFKKAFQKRLIFENPMLDVIKPKSNIETKKIEALTIEEEKKLINVLVNEETGHKYANIILLMLHSGLRIGEALALKTTDINLSEKTLNICRTITKDAQGNIILGKTTKTDTSARTIKTNQNLYNILEKSLKNYTENEHKLLFWDNGIIKQYEIRCYLYRIVEKYKISNHVNPHMLRHTYATRCIESGMSPVVLQKKLGHKDISITLNTYTSVFAKFEDTQDDKYDEYFDQLH
jgi:integrase